MSETIGLSPVQLLDTSILGIDFFIDDDFANEKSNAGSYSVTTSFDTNLESEKAAFCTCVIEIYYSMLSDEKSERELARLKCRYEARGGILKELINEDKTERELEKDLQSQTFSLGYCYLCSTLDNIARQSKLGKISLPSIDVDAYMHYVFEAQEKETKE